MGEVVEHADGAVGVDQDAVDEVRAGEVEAGLVDGLGLISQEGVVLEDAGWIDGEVWHGWGLWGSWFRGLWTGLRGCPCFGES
jgi:hypothetical protein